MLPRSLMRRSRAWPAPRGGGPPVRAGPTSRPGALRPAGVALDERFRRPRGAGELLVERLPVADAAAHELRPLGDDRRRVGALGEERPELRVVPAELVAGAVAVRADAMAETLRLRD